MRNKKILITGAGGFIGSHLAERLVNIGNIVTAFVRYNSRSDFGMIDKLEDKIKKVASEIYGANELEISTTAKKQLKELQGTNYEKFPVCIAKTQYSFTADPENGGLPQEHNLPIKEIRISAGAEFVVVICGDIMLMPGLPKTPAAESIYIDDKGLIQGLF